MSCRGPELVALLQDRAYSIRPGKFSLTIELLSLPSGSAGGQIASFCFPPAVPFGLVVVGGDAKMHVCSLDPASTRDSESFPLGSAAISEQMGVDGEEEGGNRRDLLPSKLLHIECLGGLGCAVIACNFLGSAGRDGGEPEQESLTRSELRVVCDTTGVTLCVHALAPQERIYDLKPYTARWGTSGESETMLIVGTGVGVSGALRSGGRKDRGRVLLMRLASSGEVAIDLSKVACAYVPKVCRAVAQQGRWVRPGGTGQSTPRVRARLA